ncbi:phosphomevalonate kinase [[Candida] railenensis]|uniref:Phosphomevalonate kinase n=1 Tax=[Candida] railenensis TaxID=45579 RepID=A0A9P0QUF1_9ASCO|nr:phosphomevalonate kinase [[Candida] railenensis]
MSAFSAPGKAFLAGGFLVLDPQYPAYVTALSSRMHAVVEKSSALAQDSTPPTESSITIKSPQFGGCWEFTFPDLTFSSVSEAQGRRNPFIEATISIVLAYLEPKSPFQLSITIYSDPGYHSQDNTVLRKSENGSKSFLFHNNPIERVAKTGLGSSAGLVTVLTTAILAFFLGKKQEDQVYELKSLVHNIAQIAHCYAQKKIGSGFDVAAATFGSIIYQRFDPEILNELFQRENFLVNDRKAIKALAEKKWVFSAQPVALPPKIKLLMGDIKGGSETPKLVSKVLKWKADNKAESDKLYFDLNNANVQFIESLKSLQSLHEQDIEKYESILKVLAHAKVVDSDGGEKLEDLGPFKSLIDSIKKIRENLRKLTQFSGAEIEPIEQTHLLDDCSSIEGVLGGVVPGAGGYDAICLLVIENSISNVLQANGERLDKVTWLDLQEESEGVVVEKACDYVGF